MSWVLEEVEGGVEWRFYVCVFLKWQMHFRVALLVCLLFTARHTNTTAPHLTALLLFTATKGKVYGLLRPWCESLSQRGFDDLGALSRLLVTKQVFEGLSELIKEQGLLIPVLAGCSSVWWDACHLIPSWGLLMFCSLIDPFFLHMLVFWFQQSRVWSSNYFLRLRGGFVG